MLLSLTIDNVVLIDHQVLELGQGFNVLTGETGAGKSMVVDALALVLGGRARPELVRAGFREAEVSALFEIEPGSRVAAKLEAAGVPFDGDLVVRRVVQSEGRSRAFLNGKAATAAQLAELAPDLCDIASQHESVSLTDPTTHLEYLDAYGRLELLRDNLSEKVADLFGVVREIERVREAERDRAEKEDFLAFQLKEIEELDPAAGEETELENERARLRHAEKLTNATQSAADRLYEGEEAVCDQLARVSTDLDAAAAIDPSLAPIARAVEAARSELSEAARGLARYASGIEANPERLAELDDRWFRLQKLLRKHGPTTTELLGHRDELKRQLAELTGADKLRGELEAKREGPRRDRERGARALEEASRRRAQAGRRDQPRARGPRDGTRARRHRRVARALAADRGPSPHRRRTPHPERHRSRGVPHRPEQGGGATAAAPHRVRRRALARAARAEARPRGEGAGRPLRVRRGGRRRLGRDRGGDRSRHRGRGTPPPGPVHHASSADRRARGSAIRRRQDGGQRPNHEQRPQAR
ncbi:MAG: AAA family ATPase [Labilithrix sp.]